MTMDTSIGLPLPANSLRRGRKKKRIVVFGAILAFVLAFLWYIGVIGGNVREVEAGRFYRSAQLSGSSLERVLRQYGIKSVVNLRGPSKKGFYLSERKVCSELGVAHYDVSLSAYHLPEPAELRKLIGVLDCAPRPVLVHCQQGADRSGLASALYANAYEGVPLDRAVPEELTWRYGHFAFAGTWRMERFFDLFRQTGQGKDLRTWTLTTYPAIYRRETGKG